MSTNLSDKIHNLLEPRRKVLGENRPPHRSLEDLAGEGESLLIEWSEELNQNEEEFRKIDVDTNQLKHYFDERPTENGGRLSTQNQRIKWFHYPRRRIFAAFKRYYETIPDTIEANQVGPKKTRRKEVAVILALDENSWIDSTPTDKITDEFQREAWLPEFIDDIYSEDREVLDQLIKDVRPGIKFALLEAYDHRIEKHNVSVGEYNRIVGPDIIKEEIEEASNKIRTERARVETELSKSINNRISDLEDSITDLETAMESSNTCDDIGDLKRELHDLRVAIGDSFIDTQESIDDLGESMGRSFIDTQQSIEKLTEETATSEELYGGLNKLADVTNDLDSLILKLRDVLGNERAEVGKALSDIQSQLDSLDTEFKQHHTTVEETVERLHNEQFAPKVGDSSFDESRELLLEMAMAMRLLTRIERYADNPNRSSVGDC